MNGTQKKVVVLMSVTAAALVLRHLTAPLLAYIKASYPDVSDATVQGLVTIPSLIGGVIGVFAGPATMLFGRRNCIVISLFSGFVFTMIYAFVGARGPFQALTIASAIVGIETGFGTTLVNATISAQFDDMEERAKWISVAMASLMLGSMIFNYFGGLIAARGGGQNWNRAYYMGFLYVPILIALLLLMPDDRRPRKKGDMESKNDDRARLSDLRHIPLLALVICFFHAVFYFGYQAYNNNFSYYIISEYGLGTSEQAGVCGALYSAGGVIVGFCYPVFQKIFKKTMVPAGYAIVALSELLMYFVTNRIAVVYIAAFFVGVGINMAANYIYASVMSLCDAKLSSFSMSLVFIFMNVAVGLSVRVLIATSSLLGGASIHNQLLAGVLYLAVSIAGNGVIFLTPIYENVRKKSAV